MILYFLNRDLVPLGAAHTNLKEGFVVVSDTKTEDVDIGIPTFSASILYKTSDNRTLLKEIIKPGNYLLRHEGNFGKTQIVISGSTDFFTIIDVEDDPSSQYLTIYAEGGGFELLNDIAPSISYDTKSASFCINDTLTTGLTGFRLRNDTTNSSDQKTLDFEEETIISRLQNITSTYDIEFKMGVDINRFEITDRWIDIAPTIGDETSELLHTNINVNKVVVKESIANIATALLPTGNDISLNYYTPDLEVQQKLDENQMFLETFSSGVCLVSNIGKERWASKNRNGRNIIKTYSTNDVSPKDLCIHAIEELKKRIEPEVNYTVDIAELPSNCKIGDRVNLVDRQGEIYVSTRILKLETSIVTGKRTATLGDYKIKSSGISEKVRELAKDIKIVPKYTWVVYADDRNGTNIKLEHDGIQKYIGFLENQSEALLDLSQLTTEKKDLFKFRSINSNVIVTETGDFDITSILQWDEENATLSVGDIESSFKAEISKDKISFKQTDTEIAFAETDHMQMTEAAVNSTIFVGSPISEVDKTKGRWSVSIHEILLTNSDYDSLLFYNVGDLCIYFEKVYVCISPTTGVWDSSSWREATEEDNKNNFCIKWIG